MNTEQKMSTATANACANACACVDEYESFEKREIAMREIMGMRYVPFIEALKSGGLPDFVREKKPEFEEDIEFDEIHNGLVQRLTRQYAYDSCSPELASQNRHELRYLTVSEFLEEYPCTMNLTKGDYDFEEEMKKMQVNFEAYKAAI